jgi:hypothetical protein
MKSILHQVELNANPWKANHFAFIGSILENCSSNPKEKPSRVLFLEWQNRGFPYKTN